MPFVKKRFCYQILNLSKKLTNSFSKFKRKTLYSGIDLKRTQLGPQHSVRFMKFSALWRLHLMENFKLGQNICPLYRECPPYSVSLFSIKYKTQIIAGVIL